MNSVNDRDFAPLPKSESSPLEATALHDQQQQRRFQQVLSRHVAVPLGFGLVSVIFFIIIVNHLISLNRWMQATDALIGSSNVLLQLMVDQETGLRGFLITGREEFLDPYKNAEHRIRPTLVSMQEASGDREGQKKRLDALYRMYLDWREYAQQAINLKREQQQVESFVGSGRGKALMDEIRQLSRTFVAEEERIKVERNRRTQSQVTILSAGYFLLSLVFSGLMAYWGRKQLLVLASNFGSLLRDQREQTNTLQQEAWLRLGQSQLLDRIIGQLPLPILCQNILTFIADYLQMAVGAVYLGVDEKRFDRIASYGFSHDMNARGQSFETGEGLVGQVAAQKRPLFLDTVTPRYFKVNSGLGEGKPAAVALLPIIRDGIVTAVLELGFTRPLEPRDIQLLERVSENIGAAIVAANYRRRLNDALADMQRLNDELQAQQEELRITNDELEEQSRALEESQIQLEAQQEELEQVNLVLKEQHDVLREKNESLQRAQELLEEHSQQLEKAGRYKSEFLANMSHELRTPLNSSLILSKLLADNAAGNLTPEQVKFAQTIYAAGNDLLALINDVLDIAKVEAGKLAMMPDQIVLAHLLETLMQQFRVQAAQKALVLELIVDPDVPEKLFTDRHRLEQVLRNLLANGIKFTERGSVLIRVTAARAERIAFSIIDTGIGIEADKLPYIFEPFYQADGTASRKYGGTGLGLSISRQLAELLGGHIDVTSESGAGSIFTLDIPVVFQPDEEMRGGLATPGLLPASQLEFSVAATSPLPVSAAAFSDDRNALVVDKKTILIIEDEVAFAGILYDLSHELNYQCLVATTAEEGLELAHRYAPNAILLDMKLPDQSGLNVLARLKDDSRTRHVPVHVISVEDRSATALSMGAIGYLVKPVSREQLRELFVEFEKKTAQKLKHVLVVEAAGEQADATVALIADSDVEVTVAHSGEQALQRLAQQSFDCVVVDLELSDMHCEDLLKRMSSSKVAFPPVIVHASRNLSHEEEARLLRYSRSIVVKGARSPERLLDEVTLFLHKVEADLSSERRSMLRLARSRDQTLESRKILVVDDDVRNIFAISSALESKGATVEIGRNGLDALAKLDAVADIDLVLMDIMMPEMDGYQAMTAIREDGRFDKLPIIAVTARAMPDDQDRCLRAGASDYVAKPVDMDRLISLIRVWLPKMQRV